jgi:DNA-directed RNA polymerase subunit RPC12/RpoP
MGKNGRLVGMILIGLGLVLLLGCSAISIVSSLSTEEGSIGGATLGVIGSLFVGLVPIGFGGYLVMQSRTEAAEQADMARQRKILDVVKTRGQVDIRDLVFELKVDTQQVRDDIYKLVGLGLFTGYVNWDQGLLYSREASQLTGNKCPNCGGEQEFVGKGVIACKYCGAEIFL